MLHEPYRIVVSYAFQTHGILRTKEKAVVVQSGGKVIKNTTQTSPYLIHYAECVHILAAALLTALANFSQH